MKKREAEALAASKPVFLTKKQRETLALKRREVSFMSATFASSFLLSSCLQHLQVGQCILASRRKVLTRGGSMARLLVFRRSAVLLLKNSMRNLKSVSSQ